MDPNLGIDVKFDHLLDALQPHKFEITELAGESCSRNQPIPINSFAMYSSLNEEVISSCMEQPCGELTKPTSITETYIT